MRIPDFDDIIFERRNKEYGAYYIRKRYNRAIVSSVVMAVLIGIMIVLIPYLRIPEQQSKKIYTSLYVTMDNLKPPGPMGMPSPPPPSVPQIKTPSRLRSTEAIYVAPKVVDSIPLIEKPVASTSDTIIGAFEGQGDINGTDNGTGNYSGGVKGGTGGGGGNGLYSEVEVMPKFKGGDINKFREWIQKKTRYTETAIINSVHGKVYITFIVENDGSVSNVKVAKGVDPLIDDEAVKAVRSSPKWSPGKQRGIAVRVAYIIMLNFEL